MLGQSAKFSPFFLYASSCLEDGRFSNRLCLHPLLDWRSLIVVTCGDCWSIAGGFAETLRNSEQPAKRPQTFTKSAARSDARFHRSARWSQVLVVCSSKARRQRCVRLADWRVSRTLITNSVAFNWDRLLISDWTVCTIKETQNLIFFPEIITVFLIRVHRYSASFYSVFTRFLFGFSIDQPDRRIVNRIAVT